MFTDRPEQFHNCRNAFFFCTIRKVNGSIGKCQCSRQVNTQVCVRINNRELTTITKPLFPRSKKTGYVSLCHRPAMPHARYATCPPRRGTCHYATGPLCHRPAMPHARYAKGPLCHRPTMPQARYATGVLSVCGCTFVSPPV